MTKTNTPNPSVVLSEGKKIRSVSKKRYAKVQSSYNSALYAYTDCEERIKSLKDEITSRTTTVKADRAKGILQDKEVALRPAQVLGKQKELFDASAWLRILGQKLSRATVVYRSVSRTSKTATKHKIAGFDARRMLASESLRNLDLLKDHVKTLFGKLGKSKSSEIAALKSLALSNGRNFHLAFMKVLRKEVTDPKFKAWISASPKAQGELSRMVRSSFVYIKK